MKIKFLEEKAMCTYRFTSMMSFATTDANGDPKPFRREFEAGDDATARRHVERIIKSGECHEKRSLVRIVVPEVTERVEL